MYSDGVVIYPSLMPMHRLGYSSPSVTKASNNGNCGGRLHSNNFTFMKACLGWYHCINRTPRGTAASRYLWSENGFRAINEYKLVKVGGKNFTSCSNSLSY